MSIWQIILTTLGAWLIHALLVTGYIRFFSSTSHIFFRAVHTAEIFIVMFGVFLFLLRTSNATNIFLLITVSLTTLLIIDLGVFGAVTDLQKRFDVFHFIAAFSAVTIAILLANKLAG